MSGFKTVDRGFKDLLVLVPGWAADARVFSTLELDYNYLVPQTFSPFTFTEDLSSFLEGMPGAKVSLFGWSLGAFSAAAFAAANAHRVDELILAGARKRYDRRGLDRIRAYLAANRRAYLYGFYRECFSAGEAEALAWFRRTLMKDYLDGMDTERLTAGLDFLARATIGAGALTAVGRTRIFHGDADRIAPFGEAKALAAEAGAGFIGIHGGGHLPFLGRDFRRLFHDAKRDAR